MDPETLALCYLTVTRSLLLSLLSPGKGGGWGEGESEVTGELIPSLNMNTDKVNATR